MANSQSTKKPAKPGAATQGSPAVQSLASLLPDKQGAKAYENMIAEAAAYLKKIAPPPQFALTLGSGLTAVLDELQDVREIPYASIPHFPNAGAPGHKSILLLAKIKGTGFAILTGRFHAYEGRTAWEVAFPMRVLAAWGIKNVILTNAAGTVNAAYKPVSLMLITDHIAMFAESALRGPNLDSFGPRFPDQGHVYDEAYLQNARQAAQQLGLQLHEGVYFYNRGPAYETPAEIRMIRTLGGDAVGMSTVSEAQVASHSGMRVLGICCLSNWAAGMKEEVLTAEEVIDAGKVVGQDLAKLIGLFCQNIREEA